MKLQDFDEQFYNSIPGKNEIGIEEKGFYHTIVLGDKKVGIVGFIPTKFEDMGFIQIIIAPEFRGQNLTKEAEEMLAKKYGLKELLATIKKENTASIRAHEKAGFQDIPESNLEELRKKGFLKDDDIRMSKIID